MICIKKVTFQDICSVDPLCDFPLLGPPCFVLVLIQQCLSISYIPPADPLAHYHTLPLPCFLLALNFSHLLSMYVMDILLITSLCEGRFTLM